MARRSKRRGATAPAGTPSPSSGAVAPRSSGARFRDAGGVALLLVYAVPLLFPPGPAPHGQGTPPDAWLLERIFPGVPAAWVAVRLLALLAAAVLLGTPAARVLRSRVRPADGVAVAARGIAPFVALGVALAHLAVAPWASDLGPAAQTAYLLALALPALVLAMPGWPAALRAVRWRKAAPAAAVILAWVALRVATDLGSPRVADVVDGWRGWLDDLYFVSERKNLLVDLSIRTCPVSAAHSSSSTACRSSGRMFCR